MVAKHTFDILNNSTNFFWGVMLEVNEATNGGLGIALLTLIFIVAAYVVIRRTQDQGKGLATALHITVILALILYYGGKVSGYEFIADIIMLGLIVSEVLTIGGLYYFRTNKD